MLGKRLKHKAIGTEYAEIGRIREEIEVGLTVVAEDHTDSQGVHGGDVIVRCACAFRDDGEDTVAQHCIPPVSERLRTQSVIMIVIGKYPRDWEEPKANDVRGDTAVRGLYFMSLVNLVLTSRILNLGYDHLQKSGWMEDVPHFDSPCRFLPIC